MRSLNFGTSLTNVSAEVANILTKRQIQKHREKTGEVAATLAHARPDFAITALKNDAALAPALAEADPALAKAVAVGNPALAPQLGSPDATKLSPLAQAWEAASPGKLAAAIQADPTLFPGLVAIDPALAGTVAGLHSVLAPFAASPPTRRK